METQGRDSHLWARERSFQRNHPCWHLSFDFPGFLKCEIVDFCLSCPFVVLHYGNSAHGCGESKKETLEADVSTPGRHAVTCRWGGILASMGLKLRCIISKIVRRLEASLLQVLTQCIHASITPLLRMVFEPHPSYFAFEPHPSYFVTQFLAFSNILNCKRYLCNEMKSTSHCFWPAVWPGASYLTTVCETEKSFWSCKTVGRIKWSSACCLAYAGPFFNKWWLGTLPCLHRIPIFRRSFHSSSLLYTYKCNWRAPRGSVG